MEEYSNLFESPCLFSSAVGCLRIDEMGAQPEQAFDFIEWSDYDLMGTGVIEFWPAFVAICCSEEHQNFHRILTILQKRFCDRAPLVFGNGANHRQLVEEDEYRRSFHPALPAAGIRLVQALYKRFDIDELGNLSM